MCICEQFARFSACDLKRALVTRRARTVCEAQRGGGGLIGRAERCRRRVQDVFFALQVEIDCVQLTVLQSSLCNNNNKDKVFDANVTNSRNKVEFVFTFLYEQITEFFVSGFSHQRSQRSFPVIRRLNEMCRCLLPAGRGWGWSSAPSCSGGRLRPLSPRCRTTSTG